MVLKHLSSVLEYNFKGLVLPLYYMLETNIVLFTALH